MNHPDTTKRGTPYSKTWDAAWRHAVDVTEDKIAGRCCGAHAPDGTPCKLQSNHENGRCRFHGGVDGIGAPKGNTHAMLHGLYSRRLQQCGPQCPMWTTCPFAGRDIEQLDPKHRPVCAYEQREYELLHQLDEQSDRAPYHTQPDPMDRDPHPHIAHIASLRENLHLLQIMITRASMAMKSQGVTQETVVTSDNYAMTSAKPSAALQALQILNREYRSTLGLLHRIVERYQLPKKLAEVEDSLCEGEPPGEPQWEGEPPGEPGEVSGSGLTSGSAGALPSHRVMSDSDTYSVNADRRIDTDAFSPEESQDDVPAVNTDSETRELDIRTDDRKSTSAGAPIKPEELVARRGSTSSESTDVQAAESEYP